MEEDRPIVDDHGPSTLVERALAGDPSAREDLARRCLQLALRTAIAVLGSRQEASDVAQDVAVEVLRGLPGLREPASLDAWVHRITVRRALRALRTRRLLLRRERSLSELPESEEPAAAGAGGPLLSPALQRALLSLPARQRLAVALRYLQDLSEDQVAVALGCSPGTAASLLSRARASLRVVPELREFGASRDVSEDQ